MPEPPTEYTNALNALKSFRAKVFNDLVGGRVKALLDAQHEGMQKYANVMDILGVTPYFMGYIRHMVVALGFKGQNIGAGALRDVRLEYTGDQAKYPFNPPYAVPQRNLPQVDYFVFSPVYDLELLDKTNTAQLQSGLLIQADSGLFRDTPDAENAQYDYYMVYPNIKKRGDWELTGVNTFFGNVNRINGEVVECIRDLIKDDTGERHQYYLYVWLDAMFKLDGTYVSPFAISFVGAQSAGAPTVHANVIGQRIQSVGGGLWGATKYQDALRGFAQVSTGASEMAGQDTVWRNTFMLTIEVNDPARGHTVPAVGDYDYTAMLAVGVTAYAHAGYKFDHWERDGVTYTTDNPCSIYMYKDYKLKAVFVPV